MISETSTVDDVTASSDAPQSRVREYLARWLPGSIAALLCLALAIISVHTLPSVPDYDEFSWIVWGRELAHQVVGAPQPFNLLGGPSWKPFPVLFTTIFGATGSAVSLWVVFVRAVGLFGLWLAYLVGSRLGASERWSGAGPVAGVLSAVAVCLTLQWFHFMFRATSEPLTITATLLWVERMLAGRRLCGLLAGVALATMRPEASAFVAVYTLWLLWRERETRRRVLAVAGALLVPAAWVIPPWIANGQPLQASSRARQYAGNQGHEVATFVLQRAHTLLLWPVIVLAAVAFVIAIWRRERAVIGLGLASLAYVGVIELMAVKGFPGLPRFMLPAAAVVSVLAAVAVARVGSLLGGGLPAAGLAVVIVAATVPFAINRASQPAHEYRLAEVAMHYDRGLITAVRRAGGRHAVLPCRSSQAVVNHIVGPSLAFDLGVPLTRVRLLTNRPSSLKRPSVGFLAHGNILVGRAPEMLRRGFTARPVFRQRMWHVERILRPGSRHENACVGLRHTPRQPGAGQLLTPHGRAGGSAPHRHSTHHHHHHRHPTHRHHRRHGAHHAHRPVSANAAAGRRRRHHGPSGRAHPSRRHAARRRG